MYTSSRLYHIHKSLPLSQKCYQSWSQKKLFATAPKTEEAASIASALTTEWKPIYKFKYIKALAGINKLKVYQAAFTAAGVPATMGMEMIAILPAGSTEVFAAIGMTGTLTLFIASYFTKNFVGFAYINCKDDLLRLAHIDFWGRRKNIEINIEDIIPPIEIPKTFLDFWVPIQIQGTKDTYKLMHRHGQILDHVQFVYVFGEC